MPMNESEKQEKPIAEYCKDCRDRVAKKCRLIGIYVPRKGGCLEFRRKK